MFDQRAPASVRSSWVVASPAPPLRTFSRRPAARRVGGGAPPEHLRLRAQRRQPAWPSAVRPLLRKGQAVGGILRACAPGPRGLGQGRAARGRHRRAGELVALKVELENSAGFPSELVSGADLRRLHPLAPSIVAGEFSPIEGKTNPLLAEPAFARAALRNGAQICTEIVVELSDTAPTASVRAVWRELQQQLDIVFADLQELRLAYPWRIS